MLEGWLEGWNKVEQRYSVIHWDAKKAANLVE